MKTAVLCRGESLTRTYPGNSEYEIVVAVNGTASAYPSTHWVFVDAPTFHKHVPIGHPTLFLHQGMSKILGRAQSEWYSHHFFQHRHMWFQEATGVMPETVPWMNWSQEAALVLCHSLCASQIDVFGADWKDAPTFDAKKYKSDNHSEERWKKEKVVWDQVLARMPDVKVNRIL